MEYAVIFDMDGVLVDSHDLVWRSHNKVLEKQGIQLSPEDIRHYNGRSMQYCVNHWNSKYSIHTDLEEHKKESLEMQLELLKKIRTDGGLIRFLKELKANRVLMGVGTSSSTPRDKLFLQALGLTEYFPVVVNANDVTRHKPDPEIFLEVAKRMRVSPLRCVVLEDAGSGIAAAKAGGMKAIGYYHGLNTLDELSRADLIVRSFSELSYSKIRNLLGNA